MFLIVIKEQLEKEVFGQTTEIRSGCSGRVCGFRQNSAFIFSDRLQKAFTGVASCFQEVAEVSVVLHCTNSLQHAVVVKVEEFFQCYLWHKTCIVKYLPSFFCREASLKERFEKGLTESHVGRRIYECP